MLNSLLVAGNMGMNLNESINILKNMKRIKKKVLDKRKNRYKYKSR